MQSYANAIVSSAEDPEKLLDQTVLEMNEDLIKMRQASAQVLVIPFTLDNLGTWDPFEIQILIQFWHSIRSSLYILDSQPIFE